MKPGDIAEIANWLSGEETEEQLKRYRSGECATAMERAAQLHGVIIGPMRFYLLTPGDEGCPEVPDHIQGPCVQLLVCEANVVDWARQVLTATGFVHDLDKQDLEKLRKITRRAHGQANPDAWPLTDAQFDTIIEEIGPDAALKTLRQDAGKGSLH